VAGLKMLKYRETLFTAVDKLPLSWWDFLKSTICMEIHSKQEDSSIALTVSRRHSTSDGNHCFRSLYLTVQLCLQKNQFSHPPVREIWMEENSRQNHVNLIQVSWSRCPSNSCYNSSSLNSKILLWASSDPTSSISRTRTWSCKYGKTYHHC
jgi:hypothetical protein